MQKKFTKIFRNPTTTCCQKAIARPTTAVHDGRCRRPRNHAQKGEGIAAETASDGCR
jgi:hypothetical protein